MEVSDLSNNNTFPSHAAEALEGGAAIPPTSGAGQGDALVGAPPSISDSWTYFKAHGTLPAPPAGQAASSALGGFGGPNAGSVSVPPSVVVSCSYGTVIPTDGPPIPGKGQVTMLEGPRACGTVRFWGSCSADPGHFKPIPYYNHCDHISCPYCWPYWQRKEAARVASRTWGYLDEDERTKSTLGGHGKAYRPRHWVLSPPAWLVELLRSKATSEGAFLDLLRDAANKEFKKTGMRGAATVYHPYRIEYDENDKNVSWRRTRELPYWRDVVDLSPHFHLAAYGYLADTEAFYKASGGWVMKQVRPLQDREDAESLMRYLLSHCGVAEGKDTVTYWGCLSSRYLKVISETVEREDEACPVCGACIALCEKGLDGNLIPTGHVAQTSHTVRTYRITTPGSVDPPAAWAGPPGTVLHAD